MILHSTGIYSYSRKHALASRRHSRGVLTAEGLQEIRITDSNEFIEAQIESDCDFVSDGQFLWKDLARPFSGKGPEEELEMVRTADTNTFMRRPNITSLEDIRAVDLSKYMLNGFEKRQIAVLGPYSYGEIALSAGGLSTEDVRYAYTEALAESLGILSSKGLSHVMFCETTIDDKLTSDIWSQYKDLFETIRAALDKVTTSLGFFFNKAQHSWKDLIELPVDNIIVDMRARDYFDPVPTADDLIDSHSFLFQCDTDKRIIMGCVNGRNGGFTPGKGLETGDWIAEVVRLARKKNENISFGITFSTHETIIPRGLADAKLKNMGAAKKILVKEGL